MSLTTRHWTLGIGASCRHISAWCFIQEKSSAQPVCQESQHLNSALLGDIHQCHQWMGVRCPWFSRARASAAKPCTISHVNLCNLRAFSDVERLKGSKKLFKKVTGAVLMEKSYLLKCNFIEETTKPLLFSSISYCSVIWKLTNLIYRRLTKYILFTLLFTLEEFLWHHTKANRVNVGRTKLVHFN